MKKIITIIVVLAVISVKATIAGTIIGTVISDSNSLPIPGIWVYALKFDTGEYCGGGNTNSDGFYFISGLTAGTYKFGVSVSSTQYASKYYNNQLNWDQATPVVVPAVGVVQNIDFSLELGASISGTVKNSTGIGQANVQVSCWADDGYGTGTQTEANGFYKCGGLPVGYNYNVVAYPPSDSNYAITRITVDVCQPGEYTDNNIILGIGAILCGKVLDAKTAEPLAGVEIEYSNERNAAYKNLFTDVDGTFCLTQLPPGIAEVKAEPDVDSGYVWNLPWGSDWICLSEGENRSERIIALEKGALVRGHIKDANGNAISGIEYYYNGRDCDGWDNTDVNGFYQIRLPVGIYAIAQDNTDEFGALPAMVTITNVNEEVNVPDIIVYTEEDGGQISGEVNNPDEHAKNGDFVILAFKAGTTLDDPNAWYTLQPVTVTEIEDTGLFSLTNLPPDVNYDIYLCVDNQTPVIESIVGQDIALNVAVGTSGIRLEYSSEGSTVRGSVKNTDEEAVLGITLVLSDSSGSFRGFVETDCNGQYVTHNVPAGTYTATAMHSKYLPASTTVVVVDGVTADVNTIIMPFAGEKEGADLNGDGEIDMLDVLEFSQAWLQSGSSEADFNQDNRVNFKDWVRMAENWQSKAIWYQE